jgi:hypothetical protein
MRYHGFFHRFNFICRNSAIMLCCIICSMLNRFYTVNLYFAVTHFLSLTDVSSAVALSAVNKTRLEWFLWQRGCNSFSHFPMALVWVSESHSMAAYTSTLLWCDVAIQWLSLRSAMSLFLCSYWYSSWDLHAAHLRQMQSCCRII